MKMFQVSIVVLLLLLVLLVLLRAACIIACAGLARIIRIISYMEANKPHIYLKILFLTYKM